MGAQMKPDSTPPINALPISSESLSLRCLPPVKMPVAMAVSGNCKPLSTHMFVSDMV